MTEALRIAFQPCGICGFRGLFLPGGFDEHVDAGVHLALHLTALIPASEDWKLAELEALLHAGRDRAVQAWLEREFGCVMGRIRKERRRSFTQGVLDAAACYNLTARGPFPDC